MRKILHISKFYPPYRGGIEDICYSIVKAVSNHYNQKVICFNDKNIDEFSKIDNIEIIRSSIFSNFANQPLSISLYKKLKKQIKEYKPDIIHLHLPNPLASLYVLMLIPKVTKLIIHWHSDIVEQGMLYKLIYPIEKAILKRADKIVVTSPNYLEHSVPLSNFKEKAIIIPNIISPDKIQDEKDSFDEISKIREKYGNNIVFFLGRHVPYKGLEYLIKAEKYINNECSILIAGSGPLTKQLQEMATGIQRIHFLGRITDAEISHYMYAAKIFAFPSISKNEAFGIVLAEAMYCKAVPVTFTIEGSGVNWVTINKQTGLEVANKDIKAYAQAIDYLFNNNKTRKIYAINAKKRVVDYFTINAIKNNLITLYNNC